MDVLTHVLAKIQTAVWGPPTLFLLMGTGLYFTISLGGLQVVKFPRALECIFEKEDGDETFHLLQLFVLPLQLVSEPEVLSVLQPLCVSAVPVLTSGCGYPQFLV